MFIKFFTSPTFNTQDFVHVLTHLVNVPAIETDGGVILDKDAFNRIPPSWLPHWVYLNKDAINNPLRIRPAYAEELPYTGFRYQGALLLTRGLYYIAGDEDPETVLKELREQYLALRNLYGGEFIKLAVYDQFTGANIYEVRA